MFPLGLPVHAGKTQRGVKTNKMTTQNFQNQLKEVNEHLNIRPAAVSDMEGIYYQDVYICGIPSNHIYEESRLDYKNEMGTPHKTTVTAKAQVENWLSRIEEMLEIEKDFNESIIKPNEELTNTGEVNQTDEEIKPLEEPNNTEGQSEDLPTS